MYLLQLKKLGDNIKIYEPLLTDNGKPMWYDTIYRNQIVDVVELPLKKDTDNVKIYPVDYDPQGYLPFPLRLTDRLFIFGYPLGESSAPLFPISKSGLIASEPSVDQLHLPLIFMDINAFAGMSGLPVYYLWNVYGDQNHNATPMQFFYGVFSGKESNGVYGALWKGSFLKNIFNNLP